MTKFTYPSGGTVEYTYEDMTFWAQDKPMAVRAVNQKTMSGCDVTPASWMYMYNRAIDYTGDDHTIIMRPDGTKEVYTYFGIGEGPYNPLGQAWKAGVLLKKELRDAGNIAVQTETLDWMPSPQISDETHGDPWIGFDTGIFLARLRERVVQRGDLVWTQTNTSYIDAHK